MINYTLPLLAYLAGSVSSAIIVCKLMGLADPRTTGSNNPGATNVLRIGGKRAAIIALLGDVLKGLLPVLVAMQFVSSPIVLACVGLGAFLGHLFPLYFGFKGGKGVATAVGVFIGLSWQLAIALFCIWIIVALLSRYSSLAALSAAAFAPIVVYFQNGAISYIVLGLIIAVFLFWRHRSNIQRLIAGTESKIRLRK